MNPLILISNDDGVHAPGIKHLWRALSQIGDLVVVAPAQEQSSVSLSITTRNPLHIEKIQWTEQSTVWSVNGTPADSIKLALNVILPRKPDLIVSGINRGGNAGRNVLYSGTVGAIIEGVLHNVPGVAFSMTDFIDPNYREVEKYISPIVNYVLLHQLPAGTFLNVNFPMMKNKIKGICFAKQGKEYWAENPEKRTHPTEQSSYYWLGAKLSQFEEEHGTDIILLNEGHITAVPIYIGDLTHHNYLEKNRLHFETFFSKSLA